MSETTDNIGEVSSNVEQVSDSVTQIEEAAQQLGELAYSLQSALGQFRLEASETAGTTTQGVDFQRAKTDHYAWKTKLRNLLDGKEGLSEAEATSHEHCRLGRWIYSEGMNRYGARQEMQELEEVHKALHQSVRAVIQLSNRGQTHEAEQAYQDVEAHSDRVVALLDRLAGATG
jgi:methyl-accepting chemotaxis protein